MTFEQVMAVERQLDVKQAAETEQSAGLTGDGLLRNDFDERTDLKSDVVWRIVLWPARHRVPVRIDRAAGLQPRIGLGERGLALGRLLERRLAAAIEQDLDHVPEGKMNRITGKP